MNDLVSTSYTFTSFGEIWVVGDKGANATVMSPRCALAIRLGDLNPERMVIDDEECHVEVRLEGECRRSTPVRLAPGPARRDHGLGLR